MTNQSIERKARHATAERIFYLRPCCSRSPFSTFSNKKHNLEIEQRKGRALMTAQRYDNSCLMDVRAASEKLKAPWEQMLTRNALLSSADELSLRFGRKVQKRGSVTSRLSADVLTINFFYF